MFKKMTALLMAGTMLLGLSACASKPTDTDDQGVTAYVGTAIFEEGLDPLKGAMHYGYPFINNALIRVDPDSHYVGDLAETWEISDDGLHYTFHLRPGVSFSDGSAFTAEDVVFTYEQVKEHPENNPEVDLSRLAKVEAVDNMTVEFQLSQRYSPFFDTVATLQIVPSDAYNAETFATNPIGTGAWKVAQYDANQQIILEPNESCYYGVPKLPPVTLVYMDGDAAFAAAKSGQLDVVMVGTAYVDETIDGMSLQRFETMDVRNISLPVQPRHTVTKEDGSEIVVGSDVTSDKAVRQALAIGIDRQEIIDHALNGVGVPAVQFTENLPWASRESYTDGRADEAKELLEKAGWVDADGDGIREKDGVRCAFDVYAAEDQDRYQLAAALGESARALGIEITAKNASWDEVMQVQYSQGVVWGWGQHSPTVLPSLFDSSLFMEGDFDNVVDYENAKVDEMIQTAYAAGSPEEAVADWQAVQDEANADFPYLYLVNIQHCYFVKDGLNLSPETQIPHPHGHGIPVICNMNDWDWA